MFRSVSKYKKHILKMRVSEIRVKRIRVNQGLGVPRNHLNDLK